MVALPANITPLVPRAQYVVLRPYTSIGALVVPNLGLRLIFPQSYASLLTFAVTNPIFKATRLGPTSLLLTVAHGLSHRYCGDVFIGAGRLSASVLVCTSDQAHGYVSDIIFIRPRPKSLTKPSGPQAPRPPVWRRILAYVAFGHNHHEDIKKRQVLSRAGITHTVFVSRFLFTRHHAVLGFAVTAPKEGRIPVSDAVLYRGQKTWRRVPGTVVCSAVGRRHEVRCALVIVRPRSAVSRWHLVLMLGSGAMRLSW